VFLDDSQWVDAAKLDKAVGMKVDFYPAYLKGWAWVRRIGEVDQGKTCGLGCPRPAPESQKKILSQQ